MKAPRRCKRDARHPQGPDEDPARKGTHPLAALGHRPPPLPLLLGLPAAAACSLAGALLIGSDTGLAWILSMAGFLAACGLSLGRPRGRLLALLLLCALALHWPLIAGPPRTSDDLYRYLFEGRVTLAGESPYQLPPASPALTHLRDAEIWPRINNPTITSIYPPLAQGLFVLANLLGGTIAGWKGLLLFLELAAALALGLSLLRRGASLLPVTIFLWNPLLVFESAEGGHLDAAGAVILLLAILLFERRGALFPAGVASVAASLVKPLPLPLLPFFARSRAGLLGVLSGGVLALASMVPFVLLAPAPGLYRPDEHHAVRSADGRAAIIYDPDEGVSFRRTDPPAPAEAPPASFGAADLIGRYHFGVAGLRMPHMFLDFDARETARLRPADAPWEEGRRFLFHVRDEGGGREVLLVDPDSGVPLATLRPAPGLMVLAGIAHEDLGRGGDRPLLVIKGAESPLMALGQYFGRWSGPLSRVHDLVAEAVGGRGAMRWVTPLALFLLALALLLLGVPLAEASLAVSLGAVLLLPVIYPWYLLWALPGAVLARRSFVRIPAGILLALGPLLHFWT